MKRQINGVTEMSLAQLVKQQDELNNQYADSIKKLKEAELSLQDSFTNTKLDTDKISVEISQLKVKGEGYERQLKAIESAIADEERAIADKEKSARHARRANMVKKSLTCLEEAILLEEKLSMKLIEATRLHNEANFGGLNSDIPNSVRGIIGRLAKVHNQHGALSQAGTIPIATQNDFDRIVSKLPRH